MPPWLLLRR
ncbi:hypothetical protein CGCF415_v005733 [Colletotrichum fructicola]|uniref:Uncharacterized protein n=1 Tax=Colletotrichum siamense TaxID=690259 RepID=A0A9P5K8C9_COLSI|nr:hypothetical protein CGCSCA5_v002697 [Colletotrichum siamense]KAF4822896.1 hypothetical protein CGCTS75_v010440 [Colletotrichum tropicale]KAF4909713.1 hypothetical protein CGCF415_v005733 [Colletotrichum fructicola]KAF4928126.1 hypothetical protein CGCVW01_v002143 [Colletotrichum viniferum]KAF5512982.1 hypothetical protein CGCA056_v011811 [Colletotrichum aenigma]